MNDVQAYIHRELLSLADHAEQTGGCPNLVYELRALAANIGIIDLAQSGLDIVREARESGVELSAHTCEKCGAYQHDPFSRCPDCGYLSDIVVE